MSGQSLHLYGKPLLNLKFEWNHCSHFLTPLVYKIKIRNQNIMSESSAFERLYELLHTNKAHADEEVLKKSTVPCLKAIAKLMPHVDDGCKKEMSETRFGAFMQLVLKNRPVRLAKALLKAMVHVSEYGGIGSLNMLCKLTITLSDYEDEEMLNIPFCTAIVHGLSDIRDTWDRDETHLCMFEAVSAYIVMSTERPRTLVTGFHHEDEDDHAGFLKACQSLERSLTVATDTDDTMLQIFATMYLKFLSLRQSEDCKKVLLASEWWNGFIRDLLIDICKSEDPRGEIWVLQHWIKFLAYDRDAVHAWLASTPDLPGYLTIIASRFPGTLHKLWYTLFKIREDEKKTYRENVVMDLYTFGDAFMMDMQRNPDESRKNLFLWDAAFGAMLHHVLKGDDGLVNWLAKSFDCWNAEDLDMDAHSHMDLVADRMEEIQKGEVYDDTEHVISEAEDMGLLPTF